MEALRKIACIVLVLYAALCVGLFVIMRQPVVFGKVMSKVPKPIMPVMMVIPFKPLWFLARAGHLQVGDPAPEFDLPTLDRAAQVDLSSFRRQKPVVLIFGSYT